MMEPDLERIIQSIAEEDQEVFLAELQKYNDEHALCFFFNVEEREKRKFRRNKVRDYVPSSDSDLDSDGSETPELILRQKLAAALIRYVRSQWQPQVLKVCLRTLRILSRDWQALGSLLTDTALLTLARLGGINALSVMDEEDSSMNPSCGDGTTGLSTGTDDEPSLNTHTDGVKPHAGCHTQSHESNVNSETRSQQPGDQQSESNINTDTYTQETYHISAGAHTRRNTHECLVRGKRDSRAKGDDEEDKEEGEVWRKEAMKTLCNIVYNSSWAQERASALRYCGGVSLLTTALEKCLSPQWKNFHEAVPDPSGPPVSTELSQCATEILKILFNVTYSNRRQQPDDESAALYRHLAAVLRHSLLLSCERDESTEELQSHAVNLLSALPLECLDVLLSVPLSGGSLEWEGFNMDCVHALMLFMEKQLNKTEKLKERLTPVLNLLTESCRVHRQTRHYLRRQILPPLRDVSVRPEQGDSVKSRLVRLMTHVDTDVKDCAAELLFVLCKENVSRFVKYTGYGNAAGLLAARGLLRGRGKGSNPQGEYSSDSNSDTEEYKQAKARINPVTGRVEEDHPDPMEGMTEEEKEEEAQKLISMINRLSRKSTSHKERDQINEPMAVTPEGKLAPLELPKQEALAEDRQSEEDSEEEDK
ncbi:synembryn-A-like [Scleropages formosus]|uniref:Synembryn n=1 Tax=Scleropages formosus TaxID=113540 RepID=A0A0P7UJS3_SCLFO|nr:synembryn-A-like [Scleropages formosus]